MKSLIVLLTVVFSPLFGMDYSIVVEETNQAMADKILDGLKGYNIDFFAKNHGERRLAPFVLHAHDSTGEFIGGISGVVFGSWAYVDYAFVESGYRGQGIGTSLFMKLEEHAKGLGCDVIQLFTWEFQGIGFYEKLGYECVGVVPNWIENQYDAYFYKKRLIPF